MYLQSKVPYKVQYFYMFMMFIWMARVSPLTSFNFGKNPVLMPVYLIMLAYFYVRYCKLTFKPLICLLSIIAVWYAIICLKYGRMMEFSFPPVYYIIIAHVAFNIYTRDEFLKLFEKILVQFSVLSLGVWVLANILPSIFPAFMHSIAIVENQPPTETYSFLIGMGTSFEYGIRRNIGFTWEPGVFSCWVLIGIFVNIIRHNFKVFPLNKNKNLLILVFTLFTTLSTTGYATFGLILLFYLLNVSARAKIVISVIAAFAVPSIIGLSFMSDKINHLMDIDQDVNAIMYFSSEGMKFITPQRFAGAYFSFINFVHDFWFGYCDVVYSYVSAHMFKGVAVIVPSEGIIRILATYGVFVGTFFYYYLFKSSILLSKFFHYKGSLMFALLFMTISFSYDFWENCILMCIYFIPFYSKFSKGYKQRWSYVK